MLKSMLRLDAREDSAVTDTSLTHDDDVATLRKAVLAKMMYQVGGRD